MAINDSLQQQLIRDLLIESFESLDRFDREIMALEKGAGNADTLNSIFRIIHTIKGSSGCIGLSKIEKVAHTGESVLSLVRDRVIAITPPLISVFLEYSDALKEMLQCLEKTGAEGDADYSELQNRLQQFQTPAAAESASQGFGLFEDEGAPANANTQTPEPAALTETAEPEVASFAASLASPAAPASPAPASNNKPIPETVGKTTPSASDSAVRVEVTHLDKLMNLVGELVLARNQIVQHAAQTQENTLANAAQRLNLITTELQESVMKTRMQPIENVWTKFPRIVRDLARELGKQVNLVQEGNETELDRTIIEAIKDPLTHIVRNSVDHGIELPAARQAAGKPEAGTITLRAFHEGGQVNIEISDDGHGIDIARVKEKAIERGLISADQAARMSNHEAINLIFLPGFSTAEKVTNVSGRGVGMDVVKTNIEKIGGSVDVLSEAGRGSTLKIKIPLTLAIIPALVVTSGGERFAIPQVSLLELVRLEREQARVGIENLYGSPVYRLRGHLLPLVYLNKELAIKSAEAKGEGDSGDDSAVNIVVLHADGNQFGLVVDEINDTEEIVVKPLGKQLKGLSCFAGATIMGDGRVALILDVLGLAQQASVLSEVRDQTVAKSAQGGGETDQRQTLLVFNSGANARLAIPLSMVARLEEFPRSKIERSAGQDVVQYRGQILPLINVAEHMSSEETPAAAAADPLQVIVYSEHNRSVGLVVGKIDDIVQQVISVKRPATREGVTGSVVVQDKVTDLLDVAGVIRAADPHFNSEAKTP
jgi:two-component system chemotaxis sensor kinase CheA